MSFWAKRLDDIVEGTATPPPMVMAMRLPRIRGWEPGRVWGDWPLDKDMFHAGGSVFGGYLVALADSFTGPAMSTTLADNEFFTTSDLRVVLPPGHDRPSHRRRGVESGTPPGAHRSHVRR